MKKFRTRKFLGLLVISFVLLATSLTKASYAETQADVEAWLGPVANPNMNVYNQSRDPWAGDMALSMATPQHMPNNVWVTLNSNAQTSFGADFFNARTYANATTYANIPSGWVSRVRVHPALGTIDIDAFAASVSVYSMKPPYPLLGTPNVEITFTLNGGINGRGNNSSISNLVVKEFLATDTTTATGQTYIQLPYEGFSYGGVFLQINK